MNWFAPVSYLPSEERGSPGCEIIVCVTMSRNVVGLVVYDGEYSVLRYTPEFECDNEAKNLTGVLHAIELSVLLCSEHVARIIPLYIQSIQKSGILVKTLPNRAFGTIYVLSSLFTVGDMSTIIATIDLPKLRAMEEEQKEHYIKSLFPPNELLVWIVDIHQ
ncbi:unnamed protein product [Dicrocoelium dendriticum]|nr:unnamed protein product [Dicrocoelium dendriticum]